MRALQKSTLDNAVRDYAGRFLLPTRKNAKGTPVDGKDWVIRSMYQFHFKDEFEHVYNGLKGYLGQDAWKEFQAATKDVFTPRSDDVFAAELETRLAMRPDGTFIDGKLGSVIIGERIVGQRMKTVTLRSGGGPVYAELQNLLNEQRDAIPSEVAAMIAEIVAKGGNTPETEREITILKPIKEPVYMGDREFMAGVNANVPTFSAEATILAVDAIVDNLDEGTGAAVIQGRTGAQPADPDVATTGTNLFTLVMSDPAFGGAADNGDGSVTATASAITDDSSADATGTLGYCRISATNDGTTPLDDHIDGEAGTSGADFNFNTLSIVSGATVSMTSLTVTMSQGSTAT